MKPCQAPSSVPFHINLNTSDFDASNQGYIYSYLLTNHGPTIAKFIILPLELQTQERMSFEPRSERVAVLHATPRPTDRFIRICKKLLFINEKEKFRVLQCHIFANFCPILLKFFLFTCCV